MTGCVLRAIRRAGNALVGSTVSFSTSITTQSAGVFQVGARRLLSSASVVHNTTGKKTTGARRAHTGGGARGVGVGATSLPSFFFVASHYVNPKKRNKKAPMECNCSQGERRAFFSFFWRGFEEHAS